MRRPVRISLLLTLALTLAGPAPAVADNPYQIDDYLYSIYQRANRMRSKEECLSVADTMRQQAVKMGDLKAECIALTVPVGYWYGHKDSLKLRESVDVLKEVSRRNGYLQYYYYASNNFLTFKLNFGETETAMRLLDKMKLEAAADDFPYGIYQCYIGTANLYQTLGSQAVAMRYYEKAIDYNIEHELNQPMSTAYANSCSIALKLDDYENVLINADKGLSDPYLTAKAEIVLLEHKAAAYFLLDRQEEFEDVCARLEEVVSTEGANTNSGILKEILMDVHAGRYDVALKKLKSYETNRTRHYIASRIYGKMRLYAEQCEELEKCIESSRLRDNLLIEDEETAALGTALDNMTLSADKAERELEITLQKERQSRLLTGAGIISALVIVIAAIITALGYYRKKYRLLEQDETEDYNFLLHVGHELRTPLTLVMGNLRRVAKTVPLDETLRSRLTAAYVHTGRLHNLLDTIDAYTLIKAEGKRALKLERTPLSSWVEKALPSFADEIASAGGKISFEGCPEDVTVLMDRRFCKTLLANVMNGAIRRMDRGSVLEVRVSPAEDDPGKGQVKVTCECSGTEDDISEAFRDDYNCSSDASGSKFALIHSKPIAKAHGGTMGVSRTPDRLELSFELPLAATDC